MTHEPDLVGDFHHKFTTVDPITGLSSDIDTTIERISDFEYARKHLGDPLIRGAARNFLETCLRLL